ncbi:hypothetical protein CDL12_29574 [Handroanthus impetiginosus]|uniref:BAG domain-containing protein n=1 Tax=Handroanthus impetiginosus TaxID=429701 RepID=A0A2G9FY08_9LAMI|nr:hypothetical protein CDL12_29574 [Handroanthus impetiginosus]
MESPFFRNGRWYQQPDPALRPFSHSSSYHGVPIYVDPTREIQQPGYPIQRSPERNTGPRVVQIPVHFVGTEQVDRDGSALKIQKVVRGFLVRKFLKKIRDIKVQVDEIEERLSKSEVVEMVRRDERERLRMNESLMSLLFKLDSICGIDFGVRGCRKAVIRKAIALQERIDAIVAVDLEGNGETVDEEAEINSDDPVKPKDLSENVEFQGTLEDGSCVGGDADHIMKDEVNEGKDDRIEIKASDSSNQSDDPVKQKDLSENVEFQGTLEDGSCVGGEAGHIMKDEVNEGKDDRIEIKASDSSNQSDDPGKPKDLSKNVEFQGTFEDGGCGGGEVDHIMKDEVNEGEDNIIDVGVDREVKVVEPKCIGNGGAHEDLDSVEEGLSEKDEKEKSGDGFEKEDWKPKEGNGVDDNKRNRELLERIMEDNEKMMRLMTQLFERNEAQMRMLNALTNRVELLEKAFVCDKQRKKKKKKPCACRDD